MGLHPKASAIIPHVPTQGSSGSRGSLGAVDRFDHKGHLAGKWIDGLAKV